MKHIEIIIFSSLFTCGAHGADLPVVDEQTKQFSNYIYSVANLDGQFQGVHDYCAQYSPKNILDGSQQEWSQNNGVYVKSIDQAILKFVKAKVAPEQQESAIASLKSNVQNWFSESHDNSKILGRIKESENKEVSCSKYLGILVSGSFLFKKIVPDVHEYWKSNLNP